MKTDCSQTQTKGLTMLTGIIVMVSLSATIMAAKLVRSFLQATDDLQKMIDEAKEIIGDRWAPGA